MNRVFFPLFLLLFSNVVFAQTTVVPAPTGPFPGGPVAGSPALVMNPPAATVTPAPAPPITPAPPATAAAAVVPEISTTPAFVNQLPEPGPARTAIVTKEEEVEKPKSACPPLSSYNLTPGYRFAGISPSCQVVEIATQEINEGLIDQNLESQIYQFTYGQAKLPFGGIPFSSF